LDIERQKLFAVAPGAASLRELRLKPGGDIGTNAVGDNDTGGRHGKHGEVKRIPKTLEVAGNPADSTLRLLLPDA
jgi:hypothetical protein